MRVSFGILAVFLFVALSSTEAFAPARNIASSPAVSRKSYGSPVTRPTRSTYPLHRNVASSVDGESPTPTKKKTLKDLRAEGGKLTFNTPIGALNPFAIYYGVMSILLGLPWFLSTKMWQFMAFLTRGRFDIKVGGNNPSLI